VLDFGLFVRPAAILKLVANPFFARFKLHSLQLVQVGDSLAVVFPDEVTQRMNLRPGDSMEIAEFSDRIELSVPTEKQGLK
jgi:hypothetical protein